MRVVFDTNILISSLLVENSVPANAITIAENQGLVLYSADCLVEFHKVLQRPKLTKYLNAYKVNTFLENIYEGWKPVRVNEQITACRDADDNKFLSLAVDGKATHLITGDEDLLALAPFTHRNHAVTICTPAAFLQATGAQ